MDVSDSEEEAGGYDHSGKELRSTLPTNCNLLKQVFHPGLNTFRLICPFGLLHANTPAILLPKPAAGLNLPDAFKVTITIECGRDPPKAKAKEITS